MSEVQTRPAAPRGRSSGRGGRGGQSSRGGARNPSRQANGDVKGAAPADLPEEQGEIGQLKKKYDLQLSTLKELFPDWSDMDFVLALQESDGDLQTTIDRITEGNVSQFADVKKKDRSRSKVKETLPETLPLPTRGGRGRGGAEGVRGGRGRGTERGSRGGRGNRAVAATVNHPAAVASVPMIESPAWDTIQSPSDNAGSSWDTSAPAAPETRTDGHWEGAVASNEASTTTSEGLKSSLFPEGGGHKSWASMFAKPKPAPFLPKAAPATLAAPEPEPVAQQPSVQQDLRADVGGAEGPLAVESVDDPSADFSAADGTLADGSEMLQSESGSLLAPPKDELTEDNLEHLPDSSTAIATETAASTVASSSHTRSLLGAATPLSATQQEPIARPPMGGYATSAYKATGLPGRSASFQRRVLEQQEAVVMPGHTAVDRATVQFGSMGLNGDTETLEAEDDREGVETRAQPPQNSPPPQPRAALPPAPRTKTGITNELPSQETFQTPRQAPGLPPVTQQLPQPGPQPAAHQLPFGSQAMSQQGSQGSQQYNQFGRYVQPTVQPEYGVPVQKPYDPFGQQASHAPNQQSQYEGYSSQSQAPTQVQQRPPSGIGSLSTAQNDYSSYHTSDQQRNAYQTYYGSSYGQQGVSGGQEAPSQSRADSAFPSSNAEPSSYAARESQQTSSRFSENHLSGHNTPNPTLTGQQHSANVPQPQTQPAHSGYAYSHPYYNNPHAAYMNQYGYNQQGYGDAFPGSKGGMYAQPHHVYGLNPQSTHEYSSSPGNMGAYGGRESSLGGGFSEYGRSGSGQLQQGQQHNTASGAFGGMPDVFGRSHSGYQGQTPYGQQLGNQHTEDSLKPFGESKAGAGPNPSMNQPGRPGSAANNMATQSTQSGLSQSQSHQQGFGGAYPGHYQSGHGAHYGGLGGLGGQHGSAGNYHQAGSYGNYAAGFGGQYGNYGRGGWGGSYGH